ncbi:MAG: hypothetical protein ACYC08_09345, partial [Armatimonadota bacterium]
YADIAIGPGGDIFVSDTHNGARYTISKFNRNGDYITYWSTSAIDGPIDGDADHVYCASGVDIKTYAGADGFEGQDPTSWSAIHTIIDLSTTMTVYNDYVEISAGDYQTRSFIMSTSYGLSPEPDSEGVYTPWRTESVANEAGGITRHPVNGNVYVTDKSLNEITVYLSADGTLLRTISLSGLGVVEPRGIAVDEDGYIYVVDAGGHQVYKLTDVGALVGKWGGQGDGPGEFQSPSFIKVSSTGEVYVVDRGNHRIQKFRPAT